VRFGEEVCRVEGDMPLKGIKVGVLKEGFENLLTDPNIKFLLAPQTLKRNSRRFLSRYIAA
jgi:hypothetical protein